MISSAKETLLLLGKTKIKRILHFHFKTTEEHKTHGLVYASLKVFKSPSLSKNKFKMEKTNNKSRTKI